MQLQSWIEKSSTRRLVIIVWITAFLSRSIWFFLQHGNTGIDFYYLAMNLLQGHGFSMSQNPPYIPVTIRGPLYPFFVAFIFKIFGIQSNIPFIGGLSNILFISQLFLDSLNCVLAFFLGKFLLNRTAAFLGSMVYSLHPFPGLWNTSYCHYFLPTLLLLLGVLVFSKHFLGSSRCSLRSIALCGFFLGLAALTRPEYLFFPPFLLVTLFFLKKFRYAIRTSLLILVFLSLTIAPWTLRNYWVKGKFIPIADGLYGMDFFITTEPLYNQKFFPGQQSEEFNKAFPIVKEYDSSLINPQTYEMGDKSLTKINQQLMQMGFENIKKRPMGYLLSRIRELPYLWLESGNYVLESFIPGISKYSWGRLLREPFIDGKRGMILIFKMAGLFLFYLFPYSLAFWGIYQNREQWTKLLILFAVPAFITLIHIPFWITHHYSLQGFPFIFLLTGLGIESVLNRRRQSSS